TSSSVHGMPTSRSLILRQVGPASAGVKVVGLTVTPPASALLPASGAITPDPPEPITDEPPAPVGDVWPPLPLPDELPVPEPLDPPDAGDPLSIWALHPYPTEAAKRSARPIRRDSLVSMFTPREDEPFETSPVI